MSASESRAAVAPAAIAIFVKTPRLSPVKTRLAIKLGTQAALDFYQLACAAVASVVRLATQNSDVAAYWAIADAGTVQDWPEFKHIAQVPGGLGTKLWSVYATLRHRHNAVCLIGADAPQVSAAQLLRGLATAHQTESIVLGPARDGGFYMFAGAADLPQASWERVTYSAPTTRRELQDAIKVARPDLRLSIVETMTDVDEITDLQVLYSELSCRGDLTAEQTKLQTWLAQQVQA